VDDQSSLFEFDLPSFPQVQVIAIGDRYLHLHDRGAQIEPSPESCSMTFSGECLVERSGCQFQIEFLGQFRDGRDESFAQVFVTEGLWAWRYWRLFDSSQERQCYQGRAAGDDNGGQMMVFDKTLLSGKKQNPGNGRGLLRD
jgi:hypothetical protein